MSYRVKITLPDGVGDELARYAAASGEPASAIAAHLVRSAIAEATGEVPAPVRAPMLAPTGGQRSPPWLEPAHDGRRAWRSQTWAAVLALHARYPKELASLEAGWWRRNARVEVLSALAAWREAIDTAGQDPRDELSFHAQLVDTQRLLEQTPGVGADVFQPGPPPTEWLHDSPAEHVG